MNLYTTLVLFGLSLVAGAWNPMAQMSCSYNVDALEVTCTGTDGSSHTCSTAKSGGNGPPPKGEYLIGTYSDHGNGIDWYNLYPKSKESDKYYDYYMTNPETGRSVLGFHNGSRSLGCITVTNNTCWSKLREKVDSGSASSATVEAEKRSGWLWKKKIINIEIAYIGKMTVV